jgi:hypothetical protein
LRGGGSFGRRSVVAGCIAIGVCRKHQRDGHLNRWCLFERIRDESELFFIESSRENESVEKKSGKGHKKRIKSGEFGDVVV